MRYNFVILPVFSEFQDNNHVILRRMIILSQTGLHHSIRRGQFTPFSHDRRRSTDLGFLSVQ